MAARTIYLIKRLEVAIRTLMEADLKGLDLTPGQYTALSMLAAHPDMSSADLARRVLVTPQSMSETIIALDRKGLITRVESDGNRRVLGIRLSAAGRTLLRTADARVDGLESALFATLPPDDLQGLRNHVDAVLANDRAPRSGEPGGF